MDVYANKGGSMINIDLKFSHLFQQAIREWPENLELDLIISNKDFPDLYTVRGLGIKKDDICKKFLNTEEEILIRNMHESIFLAVRRLAEYGTQVNRNCIRASSVKRIFEEKVRDAIEIPVLNAREMDVELVEKYFSINQN
jgi:hypothetical protein